MDCKVGRRIPALRLRIVPIRIAANSQAWRLFSLQRAIHDAATANRSSQLPPYMKPESAAAQIQAVAFGAERRNRCVSAFQDAKRTSIAAPTSDASQPAGLIAGVWSVSCTRVSVSDWIGAMRRK